MWNDEFNGAGKPDSTKWGYDIGDDGWGNNELQYYTDLAQNASQENGSLFIRALKSGNKWTSARLLSKNKAEFLYGRVVFRAKLPAGSGAWPALWMLGSNIQEVGWPTSGEIDIMEHVGRNPGIVQCALHSLSSYGNTVNKKETPVPTLAAQFHEYELNWSPQKLEFRVDGILFYTYEPPVLDASTWPYDKPFFLIMNIAMGGNLGSDPRLETNGLKNGIDPNLSSFVMELDWVRVYRTSPGPEITITEKHWPEAYQVLPIIGSGRCMLHIPKGTSVLFQLSDLQNKTVLKKKITPTETELNFSNLPKGVYTARIIAGERRYEGKIVLK